MATVIYFAIAALVAVCVVTYCITHAGPSDELSEILLLAFVIGVCWLPCALFLLVASPLILIDTISDRHEAKLHARYAARSRNVQH